MTNISLEPKAVHPSSPLLLTPTLTFASFQPSTRTSSRHACQPTTALISISPKTGQTQITPPPCILARTSAWTPTSRPVARLPFLPPGRLPVCTYPLSPVPTLSRKPRRKKAITPLSPYFLCPDNSTLIVPLLLNYLPTLLLLAITHAFADQLSFSRHVQWRRSPVPKGFVQPILESGRPRHFRGRNDCRRETPESEGCARPQSHIPWLGCQTRTAQYKKKGKQGVYCWTHSVRGTSSSSD